MKNVFKDIKELLMLLTITLFILGVGLSTNVKASSARDDSFVITESPKNTAVINMKLLDGSEEPASYWEIRSNPNELLTEYCVYKGASLSVSKGPLTYKRIANIRDAKALYLASVSGDLQEGQTMDELIVDENDAAKKMKELMWVMDSIIVDDVEGHSGNAMAFQRSLFFSQYIAYLNEKGEDISGVMNQLNQLNTKEIKMLNQASLWAYSHASNGEKPDSFGGTTNNDTLLKKLFDYMVLRAENGLSGEDSAVIKGYESDMEPRQVIKMENSNPTAVSKTYDTDNITVIGPYKLKQVMYYGGLQSITVKDNNGTTIDPDDVWVKVKKEDAAKTGIHGSNVPDDPDYEYWQAGTFATNFVAYFSKTAAKDGFSIMVKNKSYDVSNLSISANWIYPRAEGGVYQTGKNRRQSIPKLNSH